ncbi:MAG TPA: site-2 protease family protein [Steroidobacteraceae bacterium]|nr:site-2 protease family protein [Steroidobacteraceae bacterium]
MKALLALMMAGKLGKVLFSAGSMLLSLAIYAQLFGWRYAAGFVLLLLVHEMGHYIAARQRGLDVGLPTFIPFVGAWINLKDQRLDAETAAFVGMAGPLLGSTGAFVVYLVALQYQLNWLLAIAYAGFVLNLFNLIPVVPLDGGHVVAVISPKIWIIGIPLLAALFLWRPSPLLIVVAILAIPRAWAAIRGKLPPPADSQLATRTLKIRYAAEYLGLVCFLTLVAFEVHSQLPQ